MTDGLRPSIAALPMFRDIDETDIDAVVAAVDAVSFAEGDVVVSEGEPADTFGLVLSGQAEVTHGPTGHRIGTAGPGSIIGELALLSGGRRSATVAAVTPLQMAIGDRDAFATLLGIDEVRVRLCKQAAQHVAANVESVAATLKDGATVLLRPILPDHADAFREGLDRLTPASRRLRFFTAGRLPPSMIAYLTDVDYHNHFAWVVIPAEDPTSGIASGRFVRSIDRADTAEIALAVDDAHHRRGIGRLLLGAIAVAADEAGITTFEGEMLRDNEASLGLFRAAGAQLTGADRSSVRMTVAPHQLIAAIDPDVAGELRRVAAEVQKLARLALTPPE